MWMGWRRPSRCDGSRPSKGCKMMIGTSKGLENDTKLGEMQLCIKLGLNILGADGVNDGDAIPNIKHRDAVNDEVAEIRNTLEIRLGLSCEQRNPLLPVSRLRTIWLTHPPVTKGAEGIFETFDRRSGSETIQSAGLDTEFEDFADFQGLLVC